MMLDDLAGAFSIAERYRAQSLAQFSTERRSVNSTIPADLEDRRRTVGLRYESAYRDLDRLSSTPKPDRGAIHEITQKLTELRRERDVIEAKVRRVIYGEESQPSPRVVLGEILQLLDPGTLVVSFFVGEKGLDIFLLSHQEGLEIRHIDLESIKLKIQVRDFRRQIYEKQSTEILGRKAEWLYQKLFQPIADRVAASNRLVILPDGPLHFLPFAALKRSSDGGGQYLIEWKPLSLAASVSAYAKLRRRGPPASLAEEGKWQLVAFGDPVYIDANRTMSESPLAVRSAVDRGIFDGLKSLPFTRRELTEIRGLFPEGAVLIHLGANAREEQAKADAAKARILHFATHGVVDPEAPFDSFIALTIPALDERADDNGILQAWEILQRPIDADLVVLSACATAIGDNRGGEGLRSLSQVFQIAGARTVVASLWNVNDASTAELMIRFYRHLRDGKPKNEALQAAQLELIRGPIETVDEEGQPITRDFSAPYYWAAFQVIGDWQ